MKCSVDNDHLALFPYPHRILQTLANPDPIWINHIYTGILWKLGSQQKLPIFLSCQSSKHSLSSLAVAASYQQRTRGFFHSKSGWQVKQWPILALTRQEGFPCGSTGKESACSVGDLGSISGLGRSCGEGKGYHLQYSGLKNSLDCIVHGVAKSWTRLSDIHFHQARINVQVQNYSETGWRSGALTEPAEKCWWGWKMVSNAGLRAEDCKDSWNMVLCWASYNFGWETDINLRNIYCTSTMSQALGK